MVKIVADFSHHNGVIDWNRVKKQVDGVILACGYGSNDPGQDDRQFNRNVSECERLGIPYGIYLYAYASNMAMVDSEIAHTIRVIGKHKPKYPVYYDIEENCTAAIAKAAYPRWEQAIKKAGFKSGLYTYTSKYNEYGMQSIKCDNLWMASYGNNNAIAEDWEKPKIGQKYNAWQYTSTARLNGVSTNVDVSQFYTDFAESVKADRTIKFVSGAVYRLYNPVTKEHFFTEGYNEAQRLVDGGYKSEGVGWIAPRNSNSLVSRLYNPVTKIHHYTTDTYEKNVLTTKRGWKYEGIAWHSEEDSAKRVPVYRLTLNGDHHYTTSEREKESLVKCGWKYEGVNFYGTK